jgi:hydroxypyruvate reductase
VYCVAIGKAAAAMMQGAVEALGEHLAGGLQVTRHGYAAAGTPLPRIAVVEADHPLPGAASLAAGRELLDFIAAVPPQAPLVFLISGGTSALVEVLSPGVDAAQLQAANDWLLASGWDIGRVNLVRCALSAIKGGRLAGYLAGHPVLNLLLSDVPGDAPVAIGSGLLVPSRAGALAASDLARLPSWLRRLYAAPPPLPAAEAFAAIRTEILRSNRDARVAAAAAGRARGLAVHATDDLVQGEAAAAGHDLAERLLAGPPGLYVWGGETTVRLPPQPGHGGRCQTLALAAAQVLAGSDIVLLAAGTDGSDGPGEDAGALVDGATLARGELDCFDAGECLVRADAGSFLEASGDLIQTGPTGSNVMDLVLALKPT